MKKSFVTSGQKNQLVQLITDNTKKGAKMTVDDLVETGVLNPDNFQKVLAQGGQVASSIVATAKEKIAGLVENMVSGCLKYISAGKVLVLGPTDGKETIAQAGETFPSYIDSDFKGWGLDVSSTPTKKTKVQVYEMVKDGTFAHLFGSFGENVDRLCLTQAQIKQFCMKHADWLRADGYGTFFLFKVNGEYFVADVYVLSGGLYVSVYRFSHDDVWHAESQLRIVVPQL